MCATDACIGDCIDSRYKFVRQEGLVQEISAAEATASNQPMLPLNQWRHNATQRHALTTNTTPPEPGYALVRQEGWCFASRAPGMVPLTLWRSAALNDFITCAGNPACLENAAKGGYTLVSTLCFGFNATTVDQMPCKTGMPSCARSDPSYFDNNYWRGRLWGPQVALAWLGLKRHDALPQARAARLVLVKQSLAAELQNWRLSRHVLENINSICAAGEDGGGWSADPFYHWGALLGHVALLEGGF
jgi:hypothetical protein